MNAYRGECVSICLNLRTTAQIYTKLENIMPLDATPTLYCLILYNRYNNMADA